MGIRAWCESPLVLMPICTPTRSTFVSARVKVVDAYLEHRWQPGINQQPQMDPQGYRRGRTVPPG
jgi:hypothetical protein